MTRGGGIEKEQREKGKGEREIDVKRETEAYRDKMSYRERDRDMKRETDKDRKKKTGRQREIERQIETETKRERQTDRERNKERQRETSMNYCKVLIFCRPYILQISRISVHS